MDAQRSLVPVVLVFAFSFFWCGPETAAAAVAQPVDIEAGQTPRTRVPERSALPARPSVEMQTEAEKRIAQLLEGRIDLAADDSIKTTQALRDLARRTDDDPAAQYLLFCTAIDRAVKLADFAMAEEIIDDLALRFRIDIPQMKTDAFVAALANHEDGAIDPNLETGRACRLIENALMADRIEIARELVVAASDLAGNGQNQPLIDNVSRWSELVDEWGGHTQQARAAALRLAQDPRDPDARLTLGRYLCFVKDDWKQGLLKLARSSDETLRTLADADLRTHRDDPARMAIAAEWRKIASSYTGLMEHRILLHAEEVDRRIYPVITGLTRYALDERMISRPLLMFDSADPPHEHWVKERLRFRGTRGLEGSGRWANLEVKNGIATLVANRAGFIETLESFPPEGVDHYQIEVHLWSDLLMGTAFEFGGQRMYFGKEGGIFLEGGWAPNVIYPIKSERYYRFLIDVGPEGISFTLNDLYLGTMKTDGTARGGIVIRGWEGHVRCQRLAVWTVPDHTLGAFVNRSSP